MRRSAEVSLRHSSGSSCRQAVIRLYHELHTNPSVLEASVSRPFITMQPITKLNPYWARLEIDLADTSGEKSSRVVYAGRLA